MRRVAVEQLTLNVDSEHLCEVFSSFGSVERASVIFDETTGLSKGFGFVEFQESVDAANCVVFMNGGVLDGNSLRVSLVEDGETIISAS